MNEHRVIQADYASWRPVSGRKVLQLVFEVPIEQTEQVMTMLGVPMPGESKWCAIALLESGGDANGNAAGRHRQTPKPSGNTAAEVTQAGSGQPSITADTATAGTLGTPAKDRRPFASLPLSQQAALRCNDNEFKLFLNASNAEDAAVRVRKLCNVGSRAELDNPSEIAAREAWFGILDNYNAYLTDLQYASARR